MDELYTTLHEYAKRINVNKFQDTEMNEKKKGKKSQFYVFLNCIHQRFK